MRRDGLRFLAIGDVFMDHVVDVPNDGSATLQSSLSEANVFVTIHDEVGGSGVLACRGALAAGFDSATCVGALGTQDGAIDNIGQQVLERLRDYGVMLELIRAEGATTGRVVALYKNPHDRVLVTDRGANDCLSRQSLTASILAEAEKADVTYASVYSLINAGPRDAVLHLVSHCQLDAPYIRALDYAPHNVDRHLSFETAIEEFSQHFNLAFVDIGLAQRYFNLPKSAGSSLVAERWLNSFERVVLIIDPGIAHVFRRGARPVVATHKHPQGSASRGQSAEFQAKILYELASGEVTADGL